MGISTSVFSVDKFTINSNCMPKNDKPKHRHFVFTWNNYPPGHETTLRAIPGTSYVLAGREVGQGGTPHLQGAVSFINGRTESSVRKLLPGCHVSIQRGSHLQSHTYCKKDGDFFEHGTPTLDPAAQAAEQTELWEAAWKSAVSGTLDDIPTNLRVKHYRTWHAVRRDYQLKPPSLPGVCGIWIHGPSGSGKSHCISSTFPNAFIKDASKWWCGYDGQEEVWLDDVDPTQSSWLARFLKIWGDRYPFQAQTKGGSLIIRPKRILVTANYSIEAMGFKPQDVDAIKRRFPQQLKLEQSDNIIF